MGKRTGSKYTTMPVVPDEVKNRVEAVSRVLSGQSTIAEEARRLGLGRVATQSLIHRGIEGMVKGVTPSAPGPKPMSESERALLEENERLRRELSRAESRAAMSERFLSVASELVRSRSGSPRSRATSAKKSTAMQTPSDDDDRGALLALARTLVGEVPRVVIALLVGRSTSSLFRWSKRDAGAPLAAPRGGGERRLPSSARAAVDQRVRETRGLIGADALRSAVPGVSRRQAAEVKRDTLRAMERERVAAARRVEISLPGVVRGFDAMHLRTTSGVRYALMAGDGAIPYRTSGSVVLRYDAASVLEALARDFQANGAPLVLRMDRASSQSTSAVRALLSRHGVLLLRGPAHHPGYYGQLERQNRDHRPYLDAAGLMTPAALAEDLERMRWVMNERMPRRALGWRTPAEVWTGRGLICDNRRELMQEVDEDRQRIAGELARSGLSATVASDRAERYAIEAALMRRGYLRIS